VNSNLNQNPQNWIGRAPRLIASRVVDLYAAVFSPMIAALFGPACRFEPSCSEYARTAMLRYGLMRGGALAAVRIARCNPIGGHGYDPVPPARSAAEKSEIKSFERESVSLCPRDGIGPSAESLENG
jgi:putative membrane protein insertion efficiency factor